MIHYYQFDELNHRMVSNVDIIKVKPKLLLKELQYRERLVAVNERYGEAQIIRNELKSLETKEQRRVETIIIKEQEKKRKLLLKNQQKELEHLMMKNSRVRNSLTIKMQEESLRLEKEIKLHVHDIKRNQNLASRIAAKVGLIRDELRRTKYKSKKMKELQIIKNSAQNTKSLQILTTTGSFPLGMVKSHTGIVRYGVSSSLSSAIGFKSTNPMRFSMTDLTKFNIKSDPANTERPINVVPEFMQSASLSAKTGKLLKSKRVKDFLPEITPHYNDKLERISN